MEDFLLMEGWATKESSKLWSNLPMTWVFNDVTSSCRLCQDRTICEEGDLLELKVVHQICCKKQTKGFCL
jgi:hypothetical protein